MKEYRRKLLRDIGIHKAEEEISRTLWSHISFFEPNDEFIHEFFDKLDWSMISKVHKLSDELILKYNHLIEWDHYFLNNAVELPIIKKFITKTTFRYTHDFETSHLTSLQKQDIQRLLDFKYMFIH